MDDTLWIINDFNGSPGLYSRSDLTEDKIGQMYRKLASKRKWSALKDSAEMLRKLFEWTKESTEAINAGRYSFMNPNWPDRETDIG